MSDLQTNLEFILQEKNAKILPENIKKGVQIFDVIGTLDSSTSQSSIKLFKSNEEMQSSQGNNEDDIALVYNGDVMPIEPNTPANIIYLDSTVTLDTPITESGYIFAGMGQISYSPTNFSLNLRNKNVEYTSEDGTTYTRTDSEGSPITLEYPLEIPSEEFKDIVSKFIKIKLTKFSGIYTYKSSEWQLLPTDLSNVQNWQVMPYTTVYGNNGIVEGSEELYKKLNMWTIHQYLMNDTPNDSGYDTVSLKNLTSEQVGVSKFKSYTIGSNLSTDVNMLITKSRYLDPQFDNCYGSGNDLNMLCKDNIGYLLSRSASMSDGKYTLKLIKYDFNTGSVTVTDKSTTNCYEPYFLNFNNDKTKICGILEDDNINGIDIYEYNISEDSLTKVYTVQFTNTNTALYTVSLDDRYVIYKDENIIKKQTFDGEITTLLSPSSLSYSIQKSPNPNYIVYQEQSVGDNIKVYNTVTQTTLDISLPFSINHLVLYYIPEDPNILILRNTFASSTEEGQINFYIIENNEIKYTYTDYTLSDSAIIIKNAYMQDDNIISDGIVINKTTGSETYVGQTGAFATIYISKFTDQEIDYYNLDQFAYTKSFIKPVSLYDKIYEGDNFLIVNTSTESSIDGNIKSI